LWPRMLLKFLPSVFARVVRGIVRLLLVNTKFAEPYASVAIQHPMSNNAGVSMVSLSQVFSAVDALPSCTRATVLTTSEGVLSLRLADGTTVDARGVLGLPVEVRAGDVVLATTALTAPGRVEYYIFAVVSALRALPVGVPLMAEYDAETGHNVVRLPRGTVRFEADGDLELASTKTLRTESERIEASASVADVTLDRGALRARRWETFSTLAKLTADVLETHATRIVTRAKNVYEEVEALAQLHAGRVRMVADEALHLHARRALVKADEDVKIKGEKIHLG
jgi:hypothetical protein